MRKTGVAIACAAMLAGPASADEMWKTDIGPIAWEKDYDGGAVFKVDMDDGKVGRFFIEGLGVNSGPRGVFTGYWIVTAEENLCSAQMTGPDGTRSKTWGRLTLSFLNPDFPSDWVMLTGECLAEPDALLVGRADTGG